MTRNPARWRMTPMPDFRPELPADITSVPWSQVRLLLGQFTTLYMWAEEMIGVKRGQAKLLKTRLDNTIRLAQTTGRGSLAERERQVKVKHVETVNQLTELEADVLALEGLSAGFTAARETLSREITARLKE